tara:strand:- start:450 stop:3833 length:3384 start_codon:yes stop_codon:yes gene_type:complete
MSNTKDSTNSSDLKSAVLVKSRFAKSTNIERDRGKPSALDGYIPTFKALEVLDIILKNGLESEAGGALSITGPYGTGKSSLAVFLDALFSADNATRSKAQKLLDSKRLKNLEKVHNKHGTTNTGFFLGTVTPPQKEPIADTILTAINDAVVRRFGKIPTNKEFEGASTLKNLMKRREKTKDDPDVRGQTPTELLKVLSKLAAISPVLLIIDEFGKNLEEATESESANSDLYLLQEIAQMGDANESGKPIFLITLQHLSFEDYFAGSSQRKIDEWKKIQGRFTDISFSDSAHETRQLIKTVFSHQGNDFSEKITQWAKDEVSRTERSGLANIVDLELIKSCYPLSPLSLAVLPILCSRFGQNERTLFSFLSEGVSAFISHRSWSNAEDLPCVMLHDIFDYFVTDGLLTRGLSSTSGKWNEIALALRDVPVKLTKQQEQVAKSIAILNLVASGSLRASNRLLEVTNLDDLDAVLSELQDIGLVTHDDYFDEFRVWQGSNINVPSLIEKHLKQIEQKPLISILQEYKQLPHVVAARHSAETGTLRIFKQQFHGKGEVQPIDPLAIEDGLCLFVLDEVNLPKSKQTQKPIVIVQPKNISELDSVSRNFAALHLALNSSDTQDDAVVQDELNERIGKMESEFTRIFEKTFSSENCSWHLSTEKGLQKLSDGRGSGPLSEAASIIYNRTTQVQYSVINKHKLSTAGAKARKQLLEGMLVNSDKKQLGFENNGPDVASYKGFLELNTLHRKEDKSGYTLAKPKDSADVGIRSAWEAVENRFQSAQNLQDNLEEYYRLLRRPPFGMKQAIIPIFLVAALEVHKNQIALYENGNFIINFGTPEAERLTKNPHTFTLKHFGNATKGRKKLIEELQKKFNIPVDKSNRVSDVLAVLMFIMRESRGLNDFQKRTKNLSPQALKLRDAILNASEPDDLLFEDFPEALGLPKVMHGEDYAEIGKFVSAFKEAFSELKDSYEKLLRELKQIIKNEYDPECSFAEMKVQLSVVNTVVADDITGAVLDFFKKPEDGNSKLIERIAQTITKKAPQNFRDDDIEKFRTEFKQIGSRLKRIEQINYKANLGNEHNVISVVVTLGDGDEKMIFANRSEGVKEDLKLGKATEDELISELVKRKFPDSFT